MGGIWVLMIGTILAWLWSMKQKNKTEGLHSPFSDDIDRNQFQIFQYESSKFYSDVSLRSVRSSGARHSLQITTTWTMSICVGTLSIWWDGIYCLWDWWKITRVFSPSIRRSNVALMLWYGEKSDLALGSGVFLVRLWWVGPGRGHMKGSLCQAAKMFSLSLMKTRTHGQTWEHACHTLYKH